MGIYVKISSISICFLFLVFKHDFIRCVDFTHIAASNTASDDPAGKQYWANWRNIVHNIGTILGTILPHVGSATQRQYWPILLTNIGPMLAINIGPILVKDVVQYWPNIGHNIAPILAALHNDNIGQYC